jgi:acetyl esterase/lipase
MANEIMIQEGVVFGNDGGGDLLCDTYTPISPSGAAVLLLYGGGWRNGDKSRMRDHAMDMAGHGLVAIAANYRLTGDAPWPAQIHDVKAAIRWIRANAGSLGIDPDKIAVQGYSAGAHLGLLATGTPGVPAFEGRGGNVGVSSAVNAMVAFFPPVLFHVGSERPSGATSGRPLLGDAETSELAYEVSPLNYASADFPSTFLLHGTADHMVPPSASVRMHEALSQAGATVEMHLYPGVEHEFISQPGMHGPVHAEVANFLNRELIEPDRFREEAAATTERFADILRTRAEAAGTS